MQEKEKGSLLSPGLDDQEITTLGDQARQKEIPEGLMVLLRVAEGQEIGKGYPVHKVPVTLGRDELSEISITDSRMSRQHATLLYLSPDFHIKDLGSTNGTFVNDKRIKQSQVKNGDRIKMGSTILEFIVSNTEPESAE